MKKIASGDLILDHKHKIVLEKFPYKTIIARHNSILVFSTKNIGTVGGAA